MSEVMTSPDASMNEDESIDLITAQRANHGLQQLTVALGWEPNSDEFGDYYDLDVAAFLIGQDGQIPHENFLVFYNNRVSPDGAVRNSGDDRTGRNAAEGETITVNLEKLDPRIMQILFTVTIFKGDMRGQRFGHVRNCFIRISDVTTGKDICRYDLEEDFSTETGIEFGRLYQQGDTWRFEALGNISTGGLPGQINKYARQFAP